MQKHWNFRITTTDAVMRDGVRLYTRVVLPEKPGKYPVILMRNSYSERGGDINNIDWCENRFAVVEQDVRGSGRSEGIIDPMRQEIEDGEDCLNWIIQQEWFGGQIVIKGTSYLGTALWGAALSGKTEITGLVPNVAPGLYISDPKISGGAFLLLDMVRWSLDRVKSNQPEKFGGIKVNDSAADHLPLRTIDEAAGFGKLKFWRDWMDHPAYDRYWEYADLQAHFEKIKYPAYLTSGWFDIAQQHTLDHFQLLRRAEMPDRVRKFTRCVIGPWTHEERMGEYPVDRTGKDLTHEGNVFRPGDAFCRNLLDHPDCDPMPGQPGIRYYVLGLDQWKESEVWPPEGSTPEGSTPEGFYLHSEGCANTRRGDGGLDMNQPGAEEEPDVFIADPANPVRTLGGHGLCTPSGSHDHSELEERTDVLVYSTEVLIEDVELAGRVGCVLYAASTAPDFDLTARLTEVFPDGKSYNLADGIRRATYRESTSRRTEYVPGTTVKLEIDLWSCAVLIRKGHRIRLEVAASNYPMYARNQQTGNPAADDVELRVGRHTIYHDADHPSHLILPVIKKA